MAQSQLRHIGRLVRDYAPVPMVRGNDARVGQVVLNVLVNAAQALDETNRDDNVVTVKVAHVGGKVRVDVSDNGVGIAPEIVPHIFDPFFTTKPVGAGTGLGLAVCHGIVSALGGEISVDRALGGGTTVRGELPIAAARAPVRPEVPAAKGRRGRVLAGGGQPLLPRAGRARAAG